jgi:hypothetical protein
MIGLNLCDVHRQGEPLASGLGTSLSWQYIHPNNFQPGWLLACTNSLHSFSLLKSLSLE